MTASLGTDGRVPLFTLDAQIARLTPDLLVAMERVLQSGRFVLGDEERAFTTELADYLGVTTVVGVASGTDALVLALEAAGLRPGGLVLTTPFSFFATAEAIVRAGGVPVFADIDPVTYNLDPSSVLEVLEGHSPVHRRLAVDAGSIAAVVVVHLFGYPMDVTSLRATTDEHGLVLIEDAAQALGSHRRGRRSGSVGDAGCFSFFPSKNLGGFGDGGAVATDDPDLAARIASLRAHGASSPHRHESIGVNSRLDELQAAFLRVKLPHLDEWVDRRRSHAAAYGDGLGGLAGVSVPADTADGGHSFQQYTIRVDGGRRDELRSYLTSRGISTAVYYPTPIHLQPALRHLGYRPGDLPVAEAAAASVLALPMYPELSPEDHACVVRAIRGFSW